MKRRIVIGPTLHEAQGLAIELGFNRGQRVTLMPTFRVTEGGLRGITEAEIYVSPRAFEVRGGSRLTEELRVFRHIDGVTITERNT